MGTSNYSKFNSSLRIWRHSSRASSSCLVFHPKILQAPLLLSRPLLVYVLPSLSNKALTSSPCPRSIIFWMSSSRSIISRSDAFMVSFWFPFGILSELIISSATRVNLYSRKCCGYSLFSPVNSERQNPRTMNTRNPGT